MHQMVGVTTWSVEAIQMLLIQFTNSQLCQWATSLSESGRAEIATEAARALPGLRDNARRINNSNGIDLLGPTLNTMVAQLSQML